MDAVVSGLNDPAAPADADIAPGVKRVIGAVQSKDSEEHVDGAIGFQPLGFHGFVLRLTGALPGPPAHPGIIGGLHLRG